MKKNVYTYHDNVDGESQSIIVCDACAKITGHWAVGESKYGHITATEADVDTVCEYCHE